MKKYDFLPCYYYEELSGVSKLELNRSIGENLRDLKIYGNSEQDNGVTPDTPIEVEDVGERVEIIEEDLENLFEYGIPDDYNPKAHLMTVGDNSLTAYILSGASSYFYKDVLYPAGTYTVHLSSSCTTVRFLFRLYNDSGSIVTSATALNGFPYNTVYKGFYKDVNESTASITFTTLYKWKFGSVFMGTTGAYGTINNIKILDVTPKYRIPIIARGKNLFDETKSQNGWLRQDGTINDSEVTKTTDFIKVRSGETLMLSYKYDTLASTNNRSDLFYDEKKNPISSSSTDYVPQNQQAKIESLQNGYVRVCYDSNAYDIQIESGNVVTEYEPYINVVTNIYLDEPLRKVGNYADYIDFEKKKVVRYIQKYIFRGTENWHGPWQTSISENSAGFYLYFSEFIIKGSIINWNGLCNRGTCVYYNSFHPTSPNQLGRCWVHTVGAYLAYHPPCTTLTDFKAWLAEKYNEGHPLCVYFILNKREEDIIVSDLPTLKGKMSYEIDTKILPSQTILQYYRY